MKSVYRTNFFADDLQVDVDSKQYVYKNLVLF
jgi:hypothetical protein